MPDTPTKAMAAAEEIAERSIYFAYGLFGKRLEDAKAAVASAGIPTELVAEIAAIFERHCGEGEKENELLRKAVIAASAQTMGPHKKCPEAIFSVCPKKFCDVEGGLPRDPEIFNCWLEYWKKEAEGCQSG